jgi:hypothetical protein
MMGGGLGSGRPASRGKVEACRSIDANWLHRQGLLRAGWMCTWQWSGDGDKVTPTNMRVEDDRLHLTYRMRIGGGEWEDVNETVRIVRMPCRFGGARPYFVCPGVVNGTPCGQLYGPGRYFLCRRCYRLAHASQSEDAQRRSMRRVAEIRRRLGDNGGTASTIPPKPRGMWRRTYERLCEQALDAEQRADEALLPHLLRLFAQTENRKGKRSFWQ